MCTQGGVVHEDAGSQGSPFRTLVTSSRSHFVTSEGDQNLHRFLSLFWGLSASAPDRPRCSGACKYGGGLDVAHFAIGLFQGASRSTVGVPTGPSRRPFFVSQGGSKNGPEMGGRPGSEKGQWSRTSGLQVTLSALLQVNGLQAL